MNLHDLFAIPCRRTPDKVALEFPGAQPQVLTYAALYDAADRLAAGLQAWGLRKGDRVAFFAGNAPDFVIAYLAVIRLGGVVVPINTRYQRVELSHILGDCTPRLVLTERSLLPLLEEGRAGAPGPEATMLVGELAAWQGDCVKLDAPVVDGDDLALILYTSGTTGRSKGAMLTHNAILATITGLLAAWAWEADDRLLLVLPLFHTHGLIVGLHCALAAGATTLLRTHFDAAATTAELLSGAATCFFAVPTIYVRLLAALAERTEDACAALSAMRLFCSGSAPLDSATFDEFHMRTSHAILERYGMTETGMNLSNPYAGPRCAGSVGLPLPGVSARIVRAADGDEQPVDVACGEAGELHISGANLFSGYWNAPETSAAAFLTDSTGRRWFRTGDLARQDPATGYYRLMGRMHDLIISGGFNIYPREIEEVLLRYPGVEDAAVCGVADVEWGERPEAWIVCSGIIDDAALTAWCRMHLASFKTPRGFHRMDALPRNAMGKVQKNLLPLSCD